MRVLYLDLDTLRPDHLGCYGYHRDTSPNIDRIAQEGIRFNNYYASDAPCAPSRTAMMTGMQGIHNGAVSHGGTAADIRVQGASRKFKSYTEWNALTRLFREEDMRTVLVSPFPERHSLFHYYAGFTEMYNTKNSGHESAEEVTPTVLDWIDRNGDEDNWYLHINYWDAHTPYRAPEEFGNPFADEPLPSWVDEKVMEEHWQKAGPHSAQDFNMWDNETSEKYPRQPGEVKGMDGFRTVIDGYDCGIRYMDQHIGKIFAALEAKGVMDEVIIVISSDHGENFGELGLYGEHATADNITCRIPFIVRWPGAGIKPNSENDALHYNIDWAPTLAEMMNKERRPLWTGKSFASALTEGKEDGHEELILSQCAHVCQRSVRHGDWIYIKTYHDGLHSFPEEMLFNVKNDPNQQYNLAEELPEVVKDMAYRYLKWHDKMMATQPFGNTSDPLQVVMHEGGPHHAKCDDVDAYMKRLEETGRGQHVELIKQRHPEMFQG
ncbi:MAG: sulfatase family protein [Endozoicomonas sp.]